MKQRCNLRAILITGALAVALAGCRDKPGTSSGPGASATSGRPNVLLITLDTTRADRLGCYRYAKARTPAIDSLAAGGMRFDNAFSHVPLTLPSHASLLTGMLPPEHGLHDNARGKLGPEPVCLAEILRGRGYKTAAFVASFVLAKQFGLERGFDVYDDRMPAAKGDHSIYAYTQPGNVVADRALEWLAARGDERFFCWVHFFDPHAPYTPPEPFDRASRMATTARSPSWTRR
ncbi:hypothetical protein LCGC14_1980940, partial [marine sediment metagenome]